MAKSFFHYKDSPESKWSNEPREFTRLPIPGEFVARESDSPWYEVRLVVHCPFQAKYEAEVYAVKVDHHAALKKAIG